MHHDNKTKAHNWIQCEVVTGMKSVRSFRNCNYEVCLSEWQLWGTIWDDNCGISFRLTNNMSLFRWQLLVLLMSLFIWQVLVLFMSLFRWQVLVLFMSLFRWKVLVLFGEDKCDAPFGMTNVKSLFRWLVWIPH